MLEPMLDVELSRLSTLEAGESAFGTLNTTLGMLSGSASDDDGVVTVCVNI